MCKTLGVDVTILPPKKDSGFLAHVTKNDKGEDELVSVQIPADADVVVLQRPAHPLQPQMVAMMRVNGIAVVVDVDDDMGSIHRNNVAYATYHPRSNSPFSWRNTLAACQEATLVTSTTPQLQKIYAKHGRGAVLDNYVPAACLRYETKETGAFGWPGTTQSHPDDLQVTGRTVQRLIDEGEHFKVVGPPSKVKQALKLKQEPDCTGTVEMIDWIRTIGEQLDVVMAPLAPSAFNAAKSRLKNLEAMSAGKPWVASPRTEYVKVHKQSGCGFLAETPKDWYNHLKRLLGDESLRKEQGEMGRAWMQGQTYEANGHLWAEAWEKALKIQRG